MTLSRRHLLASALAAGALPLLPARAEGMLAQLNAWLASVVNSLNGNDYP